MLLWSCSLIISLLDVKNGTHHELVKISLPETLALCHHTLVIRCSSVIRPSSSIKCYCIIRCSSIIRHSSVIRRFSRIWCSPIIRCFQASDVLLLSGVSFRICCSSIIRWSCVNRSFFKLLTLFQHKTLFKQQTFFCSSSDHLPPSDVFKNLTLFHHQMLCHKQKILPVLDALWSSDFHSDFALDTLPSSDIPLSSDIFSGIWCSSSIRPFSSSRHSSIIRCSSIIRRFFKH